MRQDLLRSILVGESRAYGFTIAFWGSGMLLVNYLGTPTVVEVLLYGLGAVMGFGLLSILAFRTALGNPEYSDGDFLVLSMVHYLAALAPVIVSYGIIQLWPGYAFFLSGASVSLFYNLLMLTEERISEEARYLERKLSV